jgi:FlaG/FlaF family flagellin (archaellin)
MKDKKGISPVITTVIIVAVGIAIAIAVALWMSGLIGIFTRFEKIEIRNAYATKPAGSFLVKITFINTGSADTTIDSVLVNGRLYDEWTTIGLDKTLPLACPIGVQDTMTVTISDPATSDSSQLVSGVTVNIALHTTGGKEYSAAVTLP